jgi:hypothetical protein
MNEAEWFSSNDPTVMLAWMRRPRGPFLGASTGDPRRLNVETTDRKLRLLACAACRQVWDGSPCVRCKGRGYISTRTADDAGFGRATVTIDCSDCDSIGRVGGLTDPRSRRAVEVAELQADGLASAAEIIDARGHAREVPCTDPPCLPCAATETLAELGPAVQEEWFSRHLSFIVQAALLRDIFGNPWRPARKLKLTAAGLILREGKGDRVTIAHPMVIIRQIATAIYADRRFDDLPVLADALEEAGCEDADVLGHCRGLERCSACLGVGKTERMVFSYSVESMRIDETGVHGVGEKKSERVSRRKCRACAGQGWIPLRGPHVRGCHVVDLALGRK